MLAGIITADLPLADAERLARVAIHESGHAVAALYFELPLSEVLIREDGTGHARYGRRLGRAEAEGYAITGYAGGEAERDLFPFGGCEESGDLSGIAAMIRRLDLTWGEERLDELRGEARLLVQRERPRIRAVATALVERRYLTAEAVAAYTRVAAYARVP